MHRNKGFTLIELMLAMSFVSLLLLAIGLLTIQIGTIYTRGVTLKQVNEVGLEVTNDMQRSLQAGEMFDVNDASDVDDNLVSLNGGESGRLCLGNTSYVWNTAKILDQIGADQSVNRYQGANASRPIQLIKTTDSGKKLCQRDANDRYPQIVMGDGVTELLADGDRDLALHKLTVASNEGGGLYSVSLTIGTSDQAQLSAARDRCLPPSELPDNGEEYCSVNTFDIVARAGSKEGISQ